MVNKGRREFKHPIINSGQSNPEDTYLSYENLLNVSVPDTGYSNIRWNGIMIRVRHMISLDEITEFVDGVVERCSDGRFRAERADYELRLATIVFYTNIIVADDQVVMYELLYGTNLYDTVCECVNTAQYKAIKEAVNMNTSLRLKEDYNKYDNKS